MEYKIAMTRTLSMVVTNNSTRVIPDEVGFRRICIQFITLLVRIPREIRGRGVRPAEKSYLISRAGCEPASFVSCAVIWRKRMGNS